MNLSKLHKHHEECRRHVGHKIQWKDSGGIYDGIVERVTMDIPIHGVCFWIQNKPFPKKIWSDQVWDCYCQKKGE